jgi:hypothetical protein
MESCPARRRCTTHACSPWQSRRRRRWRRPPPPRAPCAGRGWRRRRGLRRRPIGERAARGAAHHRRKCQQLALRDHPAAAQQRRRQATPRRMCTPARISRRSSCSMLNSGGAARGAARLRRGDARRQRCAECGASLIVATIEAFTTSRCTPERAASRRPAVLAPPLGPLERLRPQRHRLKRLHEGALVPARAVAAPGAPHSPA